MSFTSTNSVVDSMSMQVSSPTLITMAPRIDESSSLNWIDWIMLILNLLFYISYYVLTFLLYLLRIPFQFLSYTTYSASFTFDTYTLIGVVLTLVLLIYLVFRYKILNKYARLPLAGKNNQASPFDLHPDESMDDKSNNQYPDEFMGAFLSSIKVFGYLDKQVFHELARHLQTRKLKAGEILFRSDQEEKDFYVVVEGQVQIFVKSNVSLEENDLEFKNGENDSTSTEWEGHHLLNQVESGGTVSSLFSILSVFTENLELPIPLGSDTKDSKDTPCKTTDPITKEDLLNSKVSPNNKQIHINETNTVKDSINSIESLKKVKKSVHPNIVARAAIDTTLAVIPAQAFQKLTIKFPTAAAHIVQVILARFQRVTFLTLYRYLGLSKELLRIEKTVNELTGYGLPSHLFNAESIQRIRSGFKESDLQDTEPEPLLDRERGFLKNARTNSLKTKRRRESHQPLEPPLEVYESDYSAPEIPTSSHRINNVNNRKFKGPFSHLISELDEDADKLKESTYECMCQLIGAIPTYEQEEVLDETSSNFSISSANSTPRKTSPMSAGELFPRLIRKTHTNRSSGVTFPQMRRSSTAEDDSLMDTMSPTSSLGSLSDLSDKFTSEIQILFYPRDSILIKEGERASGLYFVLDGILSAGMASNGPLSIKNNQRSSLFFIPPGGLAGYLPAITGNASFVTIMAKTDTTVGFMPKNVLDHHVEKFPNILLCLAKRLVMQLSPLVLHIDVALEWGQINAGQILCRQGESSNAIYIVLTGRLRSIADRIKSDKVMSLDILGEYGQGESVGELEVLTNTPRLGTIHAIRDTEIAIMPSTLFNALALRHPEITISIARIIASRSSTATRGLYTNPQKIGSGVDSGVNNINLKTVAILPVTGLVPITEFAERLRDSLTLIGASVVVLKSASVTSQLGKHAFTRIGRLKLLSWLAEQEESHRLVLYVADGGVNSPWTQRCVRQADCILLVGLGDEDPSIGEYERLLIGMKTTARKELVLLHNQRSCIPGSTALWLKNRLWIHAHHHIQMNLKSEKLVSNNERKSTFVNLQHRFSKYYSSAFAAHLRSNSPPHIYTGVRSDFCRLARRLLSKSIGLVLGGGGARGIAHVGIIRALEDEGIPVDMVGGTSIGSFIGGLFARENDHVSIFGRAKMFSSQMISKWRQILDLTYPVTSMFTGHAFNRAVWKCFLDTQIEDCWLSYFAVTTNITWSRMEIHQTGYLWRYVRASMSLSGYLPPLCDHGNMLLDGGYMNNLPADIMKSFGASTIVAVDVGRVDDTSPANYGDSLSGWWVLLNRLNPFGHSYGLIPQMADIQSRLAYVSSVKQLEDAKQIQGCFYVHPDVHRFGTLEFEKFAEIYEEGYKTGKALIEQWRKDGELESRFHLVNHGTMNGRRLRRASV